MMPETVVIPIKRIHETAVIHPNARIGRDAVIGPYAVIGENVRIDDGAHIGAHAVIDGWTQIGKNCMVFPGASIGAEPQDLKFRGEKSYVFIGDNTKIREFATINRATGEGEETRVGSNCMLQSYTHVAHNCVIGNHVIMSSAAMLAGHVVVEDRAIIGGQVGVHQFVKIGRNAMVGGASKVVQDVPPFVTVDGHPASVRGLNKVGIARAGIGELARRNLKKAYKILYCSGLNLAQATAVMEEELESCEEVEHLLRFLRNVGRGICRSRKGAGEAESIQLDVISLNK
ncbi:MAG TPA: acyl-ACP--UDP-N-acetylglucosamine O-acyltransferase [Methylomusa anaerophila]|uniref:Acyl-[acyl-carrier-protein]--UDP-N-acetylglucosamine O-acyltransferase n=1 Tax=Methylomusa anaerophila TaxID=1930071 RepID=A0A348AGX4_9FIRM|nr:acyl-ACP--UDP-N-acetylglucosamine O-acyltransferase [Methylomusa anaerophila]BBB90322.1 acyl-[acyl-carrier-protein]--UDP-N-acetylglucosamine O-acyltransferase [Methylomusa anaerophila]HML89332.1 acyl-ACP--UDP-N-acetylglucosamine O-acyltransferase [Methylomusa anaerophila]